MKFVLSFLLVFLCVFATAQVPPMVLGGPQGISSKKVLAEQWLSIPVMIDTPAAPLTGTPWPEKGYIVHVTKANDTTVWHYTGKRWQRIGGAAENKFTQVITGGGFTRSATLNRFTVEASTYYIKGQYYSSVLSLLLGVTKTPNANGRIDIIALEASGPVVIPGTEALNPVSPSVSDNRIKIGFVYYPPFDSLPTISGNGIEAIFRRPGVDSIFFSTSDTTLSIKDSIGISKNDTATMLNPYRFTVANGLTKDSTVFRLGGSLNQNTNINLNTRRLTFIGGPDTTRFFPNGRVSIGGTPDSLNMLNVNGNTRVNGILRLAPSSPSNAAVIINQNSGDGSLVWAGNALSLPSNLGARNVIINPTAIFSNLTGFENVLIGRGTGNNLISGNGNTFVGNNTGTSITSSFNTMIGSSDGWGNLPSNTSRSIQLIAGGHESNRADTALLGLTTQYAFIGGGSFSNGYVRDYYFGGGNRVRKPDLSNISFFAPSGYPTAVDTIGSNFTINAGRGTGQGIGGSVIFRTSDTTTAGTTLQTLTERARVTPKGNLLVGTSTDNSSAIVNISSTTKGFLPPRMTGAQAELIGSPAEGLMIYSTDGSGATITSKGWWGYDGSTWVKLN